MSSETIACPACGHSVRVPETLFGQPVRCPACKAYFTAPTRDASGILGTPELLSQPPVMMRPVEEDVIPIRKPPSLTLPAVLMILVGLCGIAVNAGVAWAIATQTDTMLDAVRKQIEEQNKDPNKEKIDPMTITKEHLYKFRDITLFFLGVSAMVLVGGVALMAGRGYWLAVIGSVLAIVNLGFGCCFLGLPVGIYALVKLFDPDVRRHFQGA
jgi:hypothetical protein